MQSVGGWGSCGPTGPTIATKLPTLELTGGGVFEHSTPHAARHIYMYARACHSLHTTVKWQRVLEIHYQQLVA